MAANDNTIERLVDLTMTLLNAPQGLTIEQITSELPNYPNSTLSASRQQFERDKVLLRRRGIEVEVIESGAANDYRYRIDPDTYYLPDLDLSDREIAALDLALAAVAVNGVNEVDGLAKLGLGNASSASPVMDVDVSPYSPVLYQGIYMEAETRFDYSGVKRKVHPIALRFILGHWYLEAYDTADGVAKNFRVDRIESEPSLGPRGSGVVPPGAADSGRILSVPSAVDEASATEMLVLEVDAAAAWRLEQALGGSYETERRPDGTALLRIPIRSWKQARSWVIGLLDSAVVVSPETARASMVEWLTSVANQPAPAPVSVFDPSELSPTSALAGPQGLTMTPTERRLQRIFAMLEWLAEVGTVETSEVAQRFNMTVDEVVAELEFAACFGRPPYSPGELMDIIVDASSVTARLPDLKRTRQLSAPDAMVLVTSSKMLLEVSGGGADGPLATAVAKIEQALAAAKSVVIEIPQPPFLADLTRACEDGRELEVVYLADSTEVETRRVIDPLKCEVHDGQWYVWAWCTERQDFRIFHADRFKSVTVVGARPPGIDTSAVEGIKLIESEDAETALVVLGPGARWVADSVPILGRHDEADGRIVVGLSVLSTLWFGRLLLQAGPDAAVIGPEELVDCGRATAERVLRRYAATV
jgi:proteasome accessory factor C